MERRPSPRPPLVGNGCAPSNTRLTGGGGGGGARDSLNRVMTEIPGHLEPHLFLFFLRSQLSASIVSGTASERDAYTRRLCT